MLVIRRDAGDAVIFAIGEDVVGVLIVLGGRCLIGVQAPRRVRVERAEGSKYDQAAATALSDWPRLTLTRDVGQSAVMHVGVERVLMTILEGDRVQWVFRAPPDVKVWREEIEPRGATA